MTKEQYIALKEKSKIDLNLAWQMYNDTNHPKARLGMHEFMQWFPIWISYGNGNGRKFWDYYDEKFGIK